MLPLIIDKANGNTVNDKAAALQKEETLICKAATFFAF